MDIFIAVALAFVTGLFLGGHVAIAIIRRMNRNA
jgi:hypothetical protein